jgi:predicted nuclease of predicted toxin-antitoxin system
VSQNSAVLKTFIDQCVPESAGIALKELGHNVTFLREQLATDSPDSLVAAVAERNDAILVSLDGDFRVIARRHGVGRRAYRRLSLIKLSCRESRAAERLRLCMSTILHEWHLSQGLRDRRLLMEIGDSMIRINR